MTRRLAQAALAISAAIPLLTVLWLISAYGHNIPYMEEWFTTGEVAIRTASGTLRSEDLFSPWKDHRMLLLNLIAAINTALFGWDLLLQQGFTVLIALANFVLLLRLWRLSDLPHRAAYAVPLSLLVFSLHQAETWLWGFQIAWQFLNLSFLVALISVLRPVPSARFTLLSGALCLLSMLTLSNTLLIFPLILGALLLRGGGSRAEFGFWALCTLIAFGIYVSISGQHSAVRPPFLHGMMQFLIFLSRSFFLPQEPYSGAVVVYGVAGLITAAGLASAIGVCLLREWRTDVRWPSVTLRRFIPWLIFLGYGAANGLAGVLNRWELNLGYAADSRYVTASIFFWIGLLGCLALCSILVIRWRGLFHVLTALMTLGLAITLADGLRQPEHLTWVTRITEDDIACAVALPEAGYSACLDGMSVFRLHREYDLEDPAVLAAYQARVSALMEYRLALFGDNSSSAALTPSPQLTGGS